MVHYRVHKNPPLVFVRSRMNQGHPVPLRTILNITLPSTPMSSKWFLPFRFSYHIFVCFLFSSMHATCPGHLLEFISLNIYFIGWRKLRNEELHNFYSSSNIIRIMKLSRVRWAGHVTRKERSIQSFGR
jgi:hypothetical protein